MHNIFAYSLHYSDSCEGTCFIGDSRGCVSGGSCSGLIGGSGVNEVVVEEEVLALVEEAVVVTVKEAAMV